MSVVKINAITVPAERADELVARFANRAGEVSKMPGFEAFELLRPTDDREVFLVLKEFEPTFSQGGDMAQDFLAPATRVKELETAGESAMKASLALKQFLRYSRSD